MPNLRPFACAVLFAGLAAAVPAHAQSAPVPEPRTLDEANAQRARAEQMRRDADARYAEEQQACYAKFLVNDCLDAAKKKRTATMIEARELDLPAREFQRDAKRADVNASEQKRADEAPQRAAEQQQQAEAFRAEEARRAAEREQKIADKARQAEEGRKKTAEEDARRAQKLAERAKRDAELAAKRAAREAEQAAKP